MFYQIFFISIIIIILLGNSRYIESFSKKYSHKSKWTRFIFSLLYYTGAICLAISLYVIILYYIQVIFGKQSIIGIGIFNIICLIIAYKKYKGVFRNFIFIDSLLFCNWLIVGSLIVGIHLETKLSSDINNLKLFSLIFLYVIGVFISQYLYMRKSERK